MSLAITIPLAFLIYHDWRSLNPLLLLAVVLIVLPVAMGGFLGMAALWSASEVRLDPLVGRADRALRGPIVNRDESFPLADLAVSDVILRASDDRPCPLLRLSLPRGRPLDIACFMNRDEAERRQHKIAATLAT